MKVLCRPAFVLIWIAWLCALGGECAKAGPQGDKPIKLKKSDGTEVEIPVKGALSDRAAQNIAASVQSFDKEAKNWRPPRVNGKPPDPAVVAAMQALAGQARNDSLEHLDLAYKIARRTSGGLDPRWLEAARKDIEFARELFRTKPPDSLFVRTEISASIAEAKLHYCGVADRDTRTCWQSYNTGAKLHIGRYMFRVQTAAGAESYEEVWVLQDPTVRKIVASNL